MRLFGDGNISKELTEDKKLDSATGEEIVSGYEEIDESTIKMSSELMIYVGEAIDKWAKQYGMEHLPKNMLFKKALTLMNAWDRSNVFK